MWKSIWVLETGPHQGIVAAPIQLNPRLLLDLSANDRESPSPYLSNLLRTNHSFLYCFALSILIHHDRTICSSSTSCSTVLNSTSTSGHQYTTTIPAPYRTRKSVLMCILPSLTGRPSTCLYPSRSRIPIHNPFSKCRKRPCRSQSTSIKRSTQRASG